MKKTISLLLSIILVVALSLPAMASNLEAQSIASHLHHLNQAIKSNGINDISTIEHLLQSVEQSVNGVNGSSLVLIGVDAVRDTLNGLNGGNSGGSGYTVKLMGNGATAIYSTGFNDVEDGQWYSDAIKAMSELGIINGTDTDKGLFSPDDPMQRAQFIAILTRDLYKDEVNAAPDTTPWYNKEVGIAKAHGLISDSDFGGAYEENCSREEMAYLLYNAAKLKGESLAEATSENIPDYNSIDSTYKGYVLQAVGAGLITGTDNAHTFSPKSNMTRAQASTVIYRLLNPNQRVDASWSFEDGTGNGVGQTGQVNEWGNVILDTKPKSLGNVTTDNHGRTIDEGQACGIYNWSTCQDFTRNNVKFNEGSNHPVPVAGDIVVKADGTEVKVDYYYENGKMICLRAPGCDIWTGAQIPHATNGTFRTIQEGSNGFFTNDQGVFAKSNICGELLPGDAWSIIRKNSVMPREAGSYEGQIANEWFRWEKVGSSYEWCWIGG